MLSGVIRSNGIGPVDAFAVFIDALAKLFEAKDIKTKNFAEDVKVYLLMQKVECGVTLQNALNLVGDWA